MFPKIEVKIRVKNLKNITKWTEKEESQAFIVNEFNKFGEEGDKKLREQLGSIEKRIKKLPQTNSQKKRLITHLNALKKESETQKAVNKDFERFLRELVHQKGKVT